MVNFKSALVALAATGYASAHIRSMSIPPTFSATSNSLVSITFTDVNGASTFDDYSVVIGLSAKEFAVPELGELIVGNFDLSKLQFSTSPDNVTINTLLTADQVKNLGPSGQEYTFVAAITSGLGARHGAELRFFNQTVQIQYSS